jgi:hypothetical protein
LTLWLTLCCNQDNLYLKIASLPVLIVVVTEKIRMNDVEHQPGEASPPAEASPETKMRWTAGVPRWVKVFVITALGLALLMVVAMLLSGGQHGPGRHLSSTGFDATVMYSAKAASFFSGDDASALSGR